MYLKWVLELLCAGESVSPYIVVEACFIEGGDYPVGKDELKLVEDGTLFKRFYFGVPGLKFKGFSFLEGEAELGFLIDALFFLSNSF